MTAAAVDGRNLGVCMAAKTEHVKGNGLARRRAWEEEFDQVGWDELWSGKKCADALRLIYHLGRLRRVKRCSMEVIERCGGVNLPRVGMSSREQAFVMLHWVDVPESAQGSWHIIIPGNDMGGMGATKQEAESEASGLLAEWISEGSIDGLSLVDRKAVQHKRDWYGTKWWVCRTHIEFGEAFRKT